MLNGEIGYINFYSVEQTENVKAFAKLMSEKEKDEQRAKIDEDEKKREEQRQKEIKIAQTELAILVERRNELIREKFKLKGKLIVEKIINGKYWTGMTDEMAIYSLGSPKNINSSVGSWGRHEQWIYNHLNLYFENGILTSYQEFN